MRLIEDRKDLFAGFEARGVGQEDGTTHVGARDQSRRLGAGSGVVVVEAHYHFCIAVVE
jgi:hypothetical protein